MRVLQVKDRPTTLARALAELGRVIKTLHMLGYVDSKEKRRRILTSSTDRNSGTGLPDGSATGRGEIRKAHRHEQEEQLGALGLALNAIGLWNSTYIQAAVDQPTPRHCGCGQVARSRLIETDALAGRANPHRHARRPCRRCYICRG